MRRKPLMHSLRMKFIAASAVVPPLHRRLCENEALSYFEKGRKNITIGDSMALIVTEKFLEEAGHDLDSDKPYQNVLGLVGGRAEFLAIKGKPAVGPDVSENSLG